MPPPEKKVKQNSPDSDQQRLQSFASLGSVFTSADGTREIDQIANKMKRRLREIFVCDDIWLNIFPCFGRAELGLTLALISDRFDALVDCHFKTKKWALGDLRILHQCGVKIFKFADDGSKEELPFPQETLPVNIIGFKIIRISYVDHTVIAFLHRVQRLFEEGIAFALFTLLEPQQRSWSVIAQKIWPLLTPNISELRCCKRVYLHQLRRLVSPTVLCDCTKLRSIFGYNDLLPESPADDSDGASDGQALSKWLHTPREDGRQKMLCFRCRWDNRNACRLFSMVDQLMKTFLNASASVKYVIRLEWVHIFVAPFDLENERTRERLALRCKGKELLMKRGPIVGEVNEWTEWEREAVEWDWLRLNKNMVKITITDSSIG